MEEELEESDESEADGEGDNENSSNEVEEVENLGEGTSSGLGGGNLPTPVPPPNLVPPTLPIQPPPTVAPTGQPVIVVQNPRLSDTSSDEEEPLNNSLSVTGTPIHVLANRTRNQLIGLLPAQPPAHHHSLLNNFLPC